MFDRPQERRGPRPASQALDAARRSGSTRATLERGSPPPSPRRTGAGRRLFEHAEAHYGVDEGVWAQDDHTLVVQLVAPCPYFLDVVAFYSSHPGAAAGRGRAGRGGEVRQRAGLVPAGQDRRATGRSASQSWRVNDRIRLVKSETYWDAATHAARRRSTRSRSRTTTTALNLYLTGAADWLPGNYPTDLVDQLKDRPDFYDTRAWASTTTASTARGRPSTIPRVRLALLHGHRPAADRRRRACGWGSCRRTTSCRPVSRLGYERPASRIRFDPEAARAPARRGRASPAARASRRTSASSTTRARATRRSPRSSPTSSAATSASRSRAYNQEWQAYQATHAEARLLARARRLDRRLRRPQHLHGHVGHERRQQPDGVGRSRLRPADPVGGEHRPAARGVRVPVRAASRSRSAARALLAAYRDAPRPTPRAPRPARRLRMHLLPRGRGDPRSRTRSRSCRSTSTS